MPQDSYLTISSDASGVSELANRPRLLIVDDDPEMLSVLENLFLEQGYRVKTSTDGLEAMRMIGEESFDIIVTDIFMPGASGLQVLKQAKQLQPEALVILITGFASLETAIEAIRDGAYDYITKPFKLEELKIAVRNAAEKVTLIKENRKLIQQLKKASEELALIKKIVSSGPEPPGKTEEKTLIAGDLPALAIKREKKPDQSFIGYLERVSSLRAKGLITEEEFELCKKRLFQTLS